MRFIITAQADPEANRADAGPGFDAKLFTAYMRFRDGHQCHSLAKSNESWR